jgi:hypothetical protein
MAIIRAVVAHYKSKVISFATQTHVPLYQTSVSIDVSFALMKHVPLHRTSILKEKLEFHY